MNAYVFLENGVYTQRNNLVFCVKTDMTCCKRFDAKMYLCISMKKLFRQSRPKVTRH